MSGEVSGIMEQLIVLEQLLCRIVRLHALRTNEALNTETQYENQAILFRFDNNLAASFNSAPLLEA